MNIKHYLSAMAALAMLAACSDYDPGMSENAVDLTDAEIATIEEYNANFIARYGTPAEGHTWGFGAKGSEDEMGTRAIQTNRNEWAILEDGTIVPRVGTFTKTDDPYYSPMVYDNTKNWVVPGIPSSDGLYYLGLDYVVPTGYTEEQAKKILSDTDPERNDQLHPNGDVTDEEIEYVSWWFRTHPNPTSTTPPLTEYFVQDISQDFDRDGYPNGPWKDMNAEKTKRQVDVILHHANGTTTDDGDQSIGYDMDYFSVETSDGGWEHNNNFNKQKANPIAENAPRTLKYWTADGPYHDDQTNEQVYKENAGHTISYSYHNSDDGGDYQRYKLVHLQFYGPRTGRYYDGYYLGFDYEFHENTDIGNGEYKTTDIIADGYYSNWIVKISPADPDFYEPDHKWHRIMCEDLGSTDDYDFNDLVYDVYFTGTNNQYTAHIKVLASGGTLPIYIGTYNEVPECEAHQILQNGNAARISEQLYQPVNVAAGVTADPVEITFEMKDSQDNWLTGDAGTALVLCMER